MNLLAHFTTTTTFKGEWYTALISVDELDKGYVRYIANFDMACQEDDLPREVVDALYIDAVTIASKNGFELVAY